MNKTKIRMKMTGAVVVATAFLLGITPMTAFAFSNEEEETTEITEPVAVSENKVEETYGQLTPDGNLTLVDDYGSIEAGGKQFVTVVTKKGNYFYLIIDRDDEGNETVHFLNMVDESDLLTLMEDEEAQEYIDSIAEEEPTETALVEETSDNATDTTAETDEQKATTEKKSSKTGLLMLVLVVTIAGIGGYLYLKSNKKKDTKKSGPDPDMDYTDEEEDYLSGISNEDDYEDPDIAEEYEELERESEENQ